MTSRGLHGSLAAVVLLTAGTAHAYRTGGELPELRGTERVAWSTSRVAYRVHEDGGPGVPLSTVRDTAEQAFGAWSDLECASVVFENRGIATSRARPDDGANDIYWIRETGLWAELGLGADALAITDITYERPEGGDWQIAEADILLNGAGYRWARESGNPDEPIRSLRAVLTHEAGHFLGMLHNCDVGSDPGAPACGAMPGADAHVMYPGYVGPAHYALSTDDAAGACFLYDCAVVGCPADQTCTATGCAASCGGEVCAPGEICGAAGCYSPSCSGSDCPGRCATPTDCAADEVCVAGHCLAAGLRDGDPCSDDAACASRACSAAGYCVATCSEEVPCPGGQECMRDLIAGECVPGAGVFGDQCSESAECSSRLCLESESGRSLCTRTCSAVSACPVDHDCSRVDGRDVCVPTSSGCSVHPLQRPVSPLLILVAIGVIILRQRPWRTR
ncbi:MAG: hypothetical protein R3B82_16420 [Sandaracinaceae bacterium]